MTRARPIPDTVTVQVPFRLVKRGGRKEMILPEGAIQSRHIADSTVVKAVARAFRWKRMLESGDFATLSFDNLVMSTFTSGVGTTTLPLRIYSMLKLGITPEINALGALMVVANLTILMLVMGRYIRLMFKTNRR